MPDAAQASTVAPAVREGDTTGVDWRFGMLDGDDEYARYFNILARAASIVARATKTYSPHETIEQAALADTMRRLLNSIRALRMKYAFHRGTQHRPLWIDIIGSGLPNAMEFFQLEADLRTKEASERELQTVQHAKLALLDHLLINKEDSPELLWQLSDRRYLDLIDPEHVLTQVVLGTLVRKPVPDPEYRGYGFAWTCYDHDTNAPHIYVMDFTQDVAETPLEEGGPGAHRFFEVIRREGSRAPKLAILATALDDALPIHPKELKRISLGPFYTTGLLEQRKKRQLRKHEQVLLGALKRGGEKDDFVLFLAEEFLVTKGQQKDGWNLFGSKRVREIFDLDPTNAELFERGASAVLKRVFMPHAVLQHLDDGARASIPLLRDASRIFTFTKEGHVHAL